MEVPAFGMQDLSEQALTDHVVDHHLHAVVVAVLHQHAVLLELLGRFDHRPAVVYRHGRRHFRRGVLPVLHRGEHDWNVKLPWRGVVDEIELFGLAKALEVAWAAGVGSRRRMAGGGNLLRRPLGPLGPDVADGSDPAAGNTEQVPDVPRTLAADPDVPDSHHLDRRRAERCVLRSRLGGLCGKRRRAGDNSRAAKLQELTSLQVVHS